MYNARQSTNSKKAAVTLEGRTRLPARVQDLVIELGNAMTSIQQAPGISDAILTSVRNFASVDGIAQNTAANLDRLTKQLERMEAQSSAIEQGLDTVNDVLDRVDSLEQSGYGTKSLPPNVPTNNGNDNKTGQLLKKNDPLSATIVKK